MFRPICFTYQGRQPLDVGHLSRQSCEIEPSDGANSARSVSTHRSALALRRIERLRFDDRSNGCLDWRGYLLPRPNHVLQTSIKRRQTMTIETAGMPAPVQRECSHLSQSQSKLDSDRDAGSIATADVFRLKSPVFANAERVTQLARGTSVDATDAPISCHRSAAECEKTVV